MPAITASIAAVTVPEYVRSWPMLALGLMPETTRSIFSLTKPSSARATPSEGAPEQAQAGVSSAR